MSYIFRRERARILSNYVRLFAGLLMGLFVTRMLLSAGDQLFGVYVTITVGIGVSIMLAELLRMGFVPVLGASVYQGRVQDVAEFRSNLTAAFVVSFGAATIGALFMVVLGFWVLNGLASSELEDAAWIFLKLRIVMMLVIVTLTPAMAVLLVTGRQPLQNLFVFFERLSEFVGVAAPLWLLNIDDYTQADRLVQFGVGISVLTCITYFFATWVAVKPSSDFKPRRQFPLPSSIKFLLRRIGWSSLQTISMNLYIRSDVLIVTAFLGPAGAVALGVAIRLMGYVRQATLGIVNGLDATFANLGGQRCRLNELSRKSDATELRLLSLSSSLQGGVVFQLSILLLMLREDFINVWVGNIFERSSSADMVKDIGLLSTLLVLGMSFRSLNLGWMTAMTGRGDAKHFTPWLLPGAVGNVIILAAWVLFAPETFSVISVGWVFLGTQVVTHGCIIPLVSARSLGCKIQTLIEPLLLPSAIAVITCCVVYVLGMLNKGGSNEFRITVVILAVLLGFIANLFVILRRGALE